MGNSTSALTHFISKWREHEIVLWLYITVISTFGVGVGVSDVGESRVQGYSWLHSQFNARLGYMASYLKNDYVLHLWLLIAFYFVILSSFPSLISKDLNRMQS